MGDTEQLLYGSASPGAHLFPNREWISIGCVANPWDALTRELNFGMGKTIIVSQPLKLSILLIAYLTEGFSAVYSANHLMSKDLLSHHYVQGSDACYHMDIHVVLS